MESNDAIDPLEKIMQEFEAPEPETRATPPPEPTELPHRPIILPPEIKEEPPDNQVSQQTAGAPIEIQSNTTVVPIHSIDKAFDKQLEPPAITPEATALRITDTTVTNAETDVRTAASSTINSNTQNSSVVAETDLPDDTQIRVKTETLEDGEITDEEEQTTDSMTKDNHVPATEKQLEPGLVTRIKAEPMDKASASVEEIAIINHDQATTAAINEAATEAVREDDSPPTPGRNHSIAEAGPEETLPDNFFDDLLQNADDITEAALQVNPSSAATVTPARPAATVTTTTLTPQAKSNEIKVKCEPSDSVAAAVETAPIPENFFDDLLVDHVAERVEDMVNQNLEIKYSERLKELEILETEAEKSNKAHKKHKKKKKKSHKRSHAEAIDVDDSLESKQKRSKHHSRSPSESFNAAAIQQPTRIRVKSEFIENPSVPIEIISLDDDEPPTTSAAAAAASVNVARPGRIRIKSEFATFPIQQQQKQSYDEFEVEAPDISLPVRENELFTRRSKINRNGLIIDMTAPLGFKRIKLEKDVDKAREKVDKPLTPAEKMERAKQRAIMTIDELNRARREEKEPMTSFFYTATVRKLPHSSSYFKQQIYENRSPLHNVNNVLYKFNSHAHRFNLYEWGLEEMPPNAAKIAKILGFDIFALSKKVETFKLPLKLQKIKQERMEMQEEMKLLSSQSSFLVTVATQTNEVTVLEAGAARRKNGHDIGVQAQTESASFGTQTMGMTGTNYDDIALMRQISTLNENQLLALSDFVDLITEPVPQANALDLYTLRKRMMDIYKCSQEPSALEQQVSTAASSSNSTNAAPHVNCKNIRDPRLRGQAAAALDEDEPPPPPPSASVPQRASVPSTKTRRSAAPHQKIPVITNVQSYHPSTGLLPPSSTMQAATQRYYGRGGMRR